MCLVALDVTLAGLEGLLGYLRGATLDVDGGRFLFDLARWRQVRATWYWRRGA